MAEDASAAASRAQALVDFIARDDSALQSRLQAFLPTHEYSALVLGALGKQAELFRGASEEDIEGVFTLILSLLKSMSASEQDAVIDAIAAAVTSTGADKPLVRLKMCVRQRGGTRALGAHPGFGRRPPTCALRVAVAGEQGVQLAQRVVRVRALQRTA